MRSKEDNIHDHLKLLNYAEINYKLALAVRASIGRIELTYLNFFIDHHHKLEGKELYLPKEEEELGAALFEYSALFLCATQLNCVFKDPQLEEPLKTYYPHRKPAEHISQLMRNAFTHNPFAPIWEIGREHRRITAYEVPNIIHLDISNLDKVPLRSEHFGGPLAIIKLLHSVREALSVTHESSIC